MAVLSWFCVFNAFYIGIQDVFYFILFLLMMSVIIVLHMRAHNK